MAILLNKVVNQQQFTKGMCLLCHTVVTKGMCLLCHTVFTKGMCLLCHTVFTKGMCLLCHTVIRITSLRTCYFSYSSLQQHLTQHVLLKFLNWLSADGFNWANGTLFETIKDSIYSSITNVHVDDYSIFTQCAFGKNIQKWKPLLKTKLHSLMSTLLKAQTQVTN